MKNAGSRLVLGAVVALLVISGLAVYSKQGQKQPSADPPRDAVAEAQHPQKVSAQRPEQKRTAHDKADIFDPSQATPSSSALNDQPEKGQLQGFDFSRDPLDAKKPMQTFEEIYKQDVALKPKVMEL